MKTVLPAVVTVVILLTVNVSLSASRKSNIESPPSVHHSAMLPGGTALTLQATLHTNRPATYVPPPYRSMEAVLTGSILIKRDWSLTSNDKSILGPRFDQTSCVACHSEISVDIGTPAQRSRASVLNTGIARLVDDQDIQRYGHQFNTQSTDESQPQRELAISYVTHDIQLGDSREHTLRKPALTALEDNNVAHLAAPSLRTAPALFGWGLLAEIDADTLHGMADEFDTDYDGISGRVSLVDSIEAPDKESLGRFGWKAEMSNLRQQIAAALHNDMGITSSESLISYCDVGLSQKDALCTAELDDQSLDAMVSYVRHLGVPDRRDRESITVMRGETIFNDTGCSACHVPVLKTRITNNTVFSEQIIWPYSDLLLHDMGAGLADSIPNQAKAGANKSTHREWRTTPLWGIGLLAKIEGRGFLHDGRASTLNDAILWHGGEATDSLNSYIDLKDSDKSSLIHFLESL